MNTELAADLIWNAWHEKTATYPDELSQWLNFDRALSVQSALLQRRIADGQQLRGWKIGLTSKRVREKLGTDDQPFGHIMRVLESDSRISLTQIGTDTSIEPELVVTIGETLAGPDVTTAQARAACSHLAAGMEINQNRIPSMQDFPLLVADNLTQWAIVSGTEHALDANYRSEAMRVRMLCDGEVMTDVLGDEDIIDDHFLSVAVLANVLAAHGHKLEAGQRVITGSFCRHPVSAGQLWEAQFDGAGTVRINIDE